MLLTITVSTLAPDTAHQIYALVRAFAAAAASRCGTPARSVVAFGAAVEAFPGIGFPTGSTTCASRILRRVAELAHAANRIARHDHHIETPDLPSPRMIEILGEGTTCADPELEARWIAVRSARPAVHDTPHRSGDRQPGSPYYLPPEELAVARAIGIPARWVARLCEVAGMDPQLRSPVQALGLRRRVDVLRGCQVGDRWIGAGDRQARARALAPISQAQRIRLRRMVRAAARTSARAWTGRLSAQALEHLGRVSPEAQRVVLDRAHEVCSSHGLLRSRDLPWGDLLVRQRLRDVAHPRGRAAWAFGRRAAQLYRALGEPAPVGRVGFALARGYSPEQVWLRYIDPDCAPPRAVAAAAIAAAAERGSEELLSEPLSDLLIPLDDELRAIGDRLRSTAAALWVRHMAAERDRPRIAALMRDRVQRAHGREHTYRYVDRLDEVRLVDIEAAGGWGASPERVLEHAARRFAAATTDQMRGDHTLLAAAPAWLPAVPGVVALCTPSALEAEGREQGHCVALYGQRVAAGACVVLAITTPDGQRSTAEVTRAGRVIQHVGARNARPEPACEQLLAEVLRALEARHA